MMDIYLNNPAGTANVPAGSTAEARHSWAPVTNASDPGSLTS